LIATAFSAALLALSPFSPASQYAGINWLPFLPHHQRTAFVAMSLFIESLLVYFPMGFVIACLGTRRRGELTRTAMIVLAIAIPLELSQGWIAGRYPDVTDVLGGLAGGVLGVVIRAKGFPAFERTFIPQHEFVVEFAKNSVNCGANSASNG